MSCSSNSPQHTPGQCGDPRLQARRPLQNAPPDDAIPHPNLRAVPATIARETVLVVDDDEDLRAFVRMALEEVGYAVVEAGDGLEALAVLHASDGDSLVVLTDYQMPRMDGGDLLHVVFNDPALAGPYACVLMTASPGSLPPRVRSMLDAYSIPILAKPFRLAELTEIVRRCSRQR